VLESFVAKMRDKNSELNLINKNMRRNSRGRIILTDKLGLHGAAVKQTGTCTKYETGRWLTNRVGTSHMPFHRRVQVTLRFRQARILQPFAAVYAPMHNLLNSEKSLSL
jgi:transposase-like protein